LLFPELGIDQKIHDGL